MARGRRPKPEGVRDQLKPVRSTHKKAGQAAASAAAEGEKPAFTALQSPAWLTGEGLRIWNDLAPSLYAAKLLTVADVGPFARYCRNFAAWLDARAGIEADGATYEAETYVNAQGAPAPDAETVGARRQRMMRINPATMWSDRLERQLLAAEDRFGLNPTERQRIMAARAQTGVTGDLFGAERPADQPGGDPAAKPATPAKPAAGPIGLLN